MPDQSQSHGASDEPDFIVEGAVASNMPAAVPGLWQSVPPIKKIATLAISLAAIASIVVWLMAGTPSDPITAALSAVSDQSTVASVIMTVLAILIITMAVVVLQTVGLLAYGFIGLFMLSAGSIVASVSNSPLAVVSMLVAGWAGIAVLEWWMPTHTELRGR